MAKIIVAKQSEVNFTDKKTGQPVKLFKLNVLKDVKGEVISKEYWVTEKNRVPKELIANPFTDDFVVCEADFDVDEFDKVKISNIRPE